jgi:EPS-associated MarR family transcriptional regulator
MKDINRFSEDELDIMHLISKENNLSQRNISKKLGLSLGKVNYCLQSLIDVGFIKLNNFNKSKNKFNYVYLLTPQGIKAKIEITKLFLRKKQEEYNKLYNYLHEHK